MVRLAFLFFCFVLSYTSTVRADEETNKALREVQEQMKTPEFREQQNSSEQKKFKDSIKDMAGNEKNVQDIYSLAAEILGNFQDKDITEIILRLEEAKKNPEAFYNTLSAEQKKRLSEVAAQLPATKKTQP